MLYDEYERGRQHVNGSHQRITYKKNNKNENKKIKKNNNNTYPTLTNAYPELSMGRGRTCRSNSFTEFFPNDW